MRKRTGLLVSKAGMTQIPSESGKMQAVTVLQLDETQVVGLRSKDRDGYTAICVGAGRAVARRMAQPQVKAYEKLGLAPKKRVVEFRVPEDAVLQLGDRFKADHFVVGQFVDVTAISLGKGFAGPMKRYNFSGLNASHGVSITHRSHGTTGSRQDPGRVWKNKKMAGHMGAERVTTQNIRVVRVDVERGLIFVHGAVPGPTGGWVQIRDAVKLTLPKEAPFPASVDARS